MAKKRAKGKTPVEAADVVQNEPEVKKNLPVGGKSKKKRPAPTQEEDMEVEQVKETVPKAKGKKGAISKHKQSLENLKKQDPDFYKFLEKEDANLLDFNDSSSDEESEEESEEEGEGDDNDNSDDNDKKGKKGYVHKLPDKLEVASDDSNPEDSDDEESVKKKKKEKKDKTRGTAILVTTKMIIEWSTALQESNSLGAMRNSIAAFKAALHETGSEDAAEGSRFKVEGSTVFNSVVRLCLTDLLPAFSRFLKLPAQKDPNKPVLPSSAPKWGKIRILAKSYLTDLLQMITQISEPAILNVLLKHAHQLCAYFVCMPKLARVLLKRGITIWSSGEETSRVLAFLIINRVTRYMKDKVLEFTLKKMYMAYVKNVKFTSPNTLPLINFMQRTLTEIFALDVHLTYQYAFVYIRQLAIHLRNAITVKKQENSQAVYNWQYMHSLHLWARALAELCPSDVLDPLIYPLTQTIIGTIKLVPTARYYPLRFHGVRSLNVLSEATNTYIPVLPFLLEVFELTDFNKKHKNLSFKPLNFAVILKLSNAQLNEKGFRDGVVDQMYDLLLEQFHIHAHTVSFPELALPAIVQLKTFIKQCKVANYTKQMKQILEKVELTCNVIMQRRKTATFNLADTRGVAAWEARSKEEGTPLSKYYATWRKLRDRELQHEIAGKERISTDTLPEIIRNRAPKKASKDERKEFSELFDTDSEDEDDETRFLPKGERPKKKKQKTTRDIEDDDSDVGNYSDFDDDELAELARSGDEDSDEGDDDSEGDDDDDDDDDDSEEEEVEIKASKSKQKGKKVKQIQEDDADEPDDVVEDFELTDDDES